MKRMGLIFVLDGTLWDATGMAARIWNGVFAETGMSFRLTAGDVRAQMGKTMAEIGEAFFPQKTKGEQDALMALLGEREVERMHEGGAVLYDGVAETIPLLARAYDLFIVSNCQRDYVREFIRTQSFGAWIRDYEESGRTGLGKAENIRALMERNGMDRAVYVGDTAGDERAAREAGIPFIFVRYGFGSAIMPDGEIDRFADIAGMIEKWSDSSRR